MVKVGLREVLHFGGHCASIGLMAQKPAKRRNTHDPALSGSRALQHVIEQTEGPRNTQPLKPDVKDLKQQFDAAHQKGMKALETGDYRAFGDAVDE